MAEEYRILMAEDMEDSKTAQVQADVVNILYLYEKVLGFDEGGLTEEQLYAGVKWLEKVRERAND